MRACEQGDLGGIAQLAGGVVRVADPDQVGAVRLGDELGAHELRCDPVEAVRGREDRRAAAGSQEGARADGDQLVGAGADDDLLGLDAAVRRGRLSQLAKRAVRVFVQPREARRERNLRDSGKRRRVLVEAEHLLAA